MKSFELDEQEEKSASEFMEKHKECCLKKYGRQLISPLGEGFSYIFTPGGLGNGVSIRCNACKEVENITDYSNW